MGEYINVSDENMFEYKGRHTCNECINVSDEKAISQHCRS